MATFALQVRSYCRPFRQPLPTSSGLWQERRGAIVRLESATGRVGWGEIAPLPTFGSESLAAALQFCQDLGGTVDRDRLLAIPDGLPACQFAFESALAEIERPADNFDAAALDYCYLLPTGAGALAAWSEGWAGGARTFKWKIGIRSAGSELREFWQLVAALPAGAKLRLDANGGLDERTARTWLTATDRALDCVEFFEQPLPAAQFADLQHLAATYRTPLALDESVATLGQLQNCYERGWRGLCIIKAAIAGSPQRLRQFCRARAIEAVFSSVFEGEVGRRAALRLAAELNASQRAIGFGTNHWLEPERVTAD